MKLPFHTLRSIDTPFLSADEIMLFCCIVAAIIVVACFGE